ncbi:hypothetical protein TNCV_3809791 [Trichonephila clavipes]|nr:hypothetical protein TNCV_3809791 [Trichonephila clavipes]
MIMRHVKDSLSACLAWLLLLKFNSQNNFASSEFKCLPLGRKLGVKIIHGIWYRLDGGALKSDTSSWGMHSVYSSEITNPQGEEKGNLSRRKATVGEKYGKLDLKLQKLSNIQHLNS